MLHRFHLFRKVGTIVKNELTAVPRRSYEGFEIYAEMPKSKEYLSSEDSDSSVEKAPKRKREREERKRPSEEKTEKADSSKKSKNSSKDEDKSVWDIGNNRQVSVSDFKGRYYINIREMYMDSNSGNMKPGKKGIALTTQQWQKLMDNVQEIDKAVKAKC